MPSVSIKSTNLSSSSVEKKRLYTHKPLVHACTELPTPKPLFEGACAKRFNKKGAEPNNPQSNRKALLSSLDALHAQPGKTSIPNLKTCMPNLLASHATMGISISCSARQWSAATILQKTPGYTWEACMR